MRKADARGCGWRWWWLDERASLLCRAEKGAAVWWRTDGVTVRSDWLRTPRKEAARLLRGEE